MFHRFGGQPPKRGWERMSEGKWKMDAFLELFGNVTVGFLVKLICAILFAGSAVAIGAKKLKAWYESRQERDRKYHEVMDQVAKYPEWRQQSIDIQKEFTEAIRNLQKRMEEIEATNQKRERNKLRDRLLQSYRYFTSEEKNPAKAWSEMEADAFWEMYRDYEKLGGNGHVHTEVQPAMRHLEVIPMHETERITELMQSRR